MLVPDVTTASAWVANPKVGGPNPPPQPILQSLSVVATKTKGAAKPCCYFSPIHQGFEQSQSLLRTRTPLCSIGAARRRADDGCPRCSGVVGLISLTWPAVPAAAPQDSPPHSSLGITYDSLATPIT